MSLVWKYVQILLPVLLLTGCGPGYRRTIEPEIQNVHTITKQHTGFDLDGWDTHGLLTEEEVQQGLSIEAALQNAILTAPELYVNFEELGIAKADLVQAGFFRNPEVAALFQGVNSSDPKATQLYIDVVASMNISDFWQIPLRKKVARDELEIKTIDALRLIVETAADARLSYYTYLYETTQIKTTEKILDTVQNLRTTAEQNYITDYVSDYDLFVADATIMQWEIKKLDLEQSLHAAALDLRNFIGLELLPVSIPLTSSWESLLRPLPDKQALFAYAEHNNPALQIANLKIAQAHHQQELARSKTFDNVTFGLEFTRDNTGTKYIGPAIGFDLPVFDQQQAQIERAQRQEKKLRRELSNMLANYSQDIFSAHKTVTNLQKKIEFYKTKILPSARTALEHAQKHVGNLKLNFSFFINNQINLLQQEYDLNRDYLALAQAFNKLEKAIGGAIPYDLTPHAPNSSSSGTIK